MIIIRKKLRRIIPYRIVLWPTEAALKELADGLSPAEAARVEGTALQLNGGRCVVSNFLSLTLVLDLRRGPDQLYRDMITNARIRINKAEKLGKRINIRRYAEGADNDRLLDDFIWLYGQAIGGRSETMFPISRELVRSYFPSADMIIVDLDGKPLCGHLNLLDRAGGNSRLEYSASRRFDDPETRRLAGILNVYLHWYEIRKYCEEGLVSYDFGGIGGADDNVGVNRFKLQFGGSIIREQNYILAGMPRLWRAASYGFETMTTRGHRRRKLRMAGERWRSMEPKRIDEAIRGSVEEYEHRLAHTGNHNGNGNGSGAPQAKRGPEESRAPSPNE